MTENINNVTIPQKAITSFGPEISIVIPVYNDEAAIGKSLRLLTDFINLGGLNAEVLIINDGGKDKTLETVKNEMQKFPFIKLIDRKKNKGKGFTVREGFGAAQGDIILFTDADLPYGTKYFEKFIEAINSGADLAIANRNLLKFMKEKKSPGLLRTLNHWGTIFFVKMLLGLPFSDTQAGLKGIKKEAAMRLLPKLTIDRYAFDLELLVAAKKSNFKIAEIPVALENVGSSHINILRDTLEALRDALKIWWRIKKGLY